MPTGRYAVMNGKGTPVGTEEFRSAPGPAGWRYFSTIETSVPEPHREVVDLVVDDGWRPVRVRIDTGSHRAELAPDGDHVSGVIDGEPVALRWGPEREIDYLSPCFNAVTARRLGRTAEIDVVYLQPVTCRPVDLRQRYELLGHDEVTTPVGVFAATRWRYTELRGGFTALFWLAGDTVVEYEGVFRLEDYEPGAHGAVPRPG